LSTVDETEEDNINELEIQIEGDAEILKIHHEDTTESDPEPPPANEKPRLPLRKSKSHAAMGGGSRSSGRRLGGKTSSRTFDLGSFKKSPNSSFRLSDKSLCKCFRSLLDPNMGSLTSWFQIRGSWLQIWGFLIQALVPSMDSGFRYEASWFQI
jgi:hypothetical protein